MSLEAIKWNQGKLQILDQLLLPTESKYIDIKDTKDAWKAINSMQVRGAPAIAIVGSLSLAAEILNSGLDFPTKQALSSFVNEKMDYLVTARPTAVNIKTAQQDLEELGTKLCHNDCISTSEFQKWIISWCESTLSVDVATNKVIGENGARHLRLKFPDKSKFVVLTHCNTGSLATAGYGTALGVIRCLFSTNQLEMVYVGETRPYNQGSRLTAYELVHDKIPATLICDDMVAAMMKIKGCDAVFVGADRVALNGDTANKIGTYQIAVLAKHHGIPFYVCAPLTTVDFEMANGDSIPIEERPDTEMTSAGGKRIAAPGVTCWNPAFDVTPAELITGGIVTERGVYDPADLYTLSK